MKFSTIISRTVFAVSLACASAFVAVAPAQAAAPMQHKEVAGVTNRPGTAWMQIVMKKGTSDFAKSFTPDATLQTSALSKAVVGPTLIGAFFAATSKMYEQFVFTAETIDGAKTYLEWEGIHGGKPVAGATIITRNESGLINNIKLFQSPFPVVREFSSGLKERLEGTLGQDFFN
ncbi:hypothetical protein [Geomonas ferrireducens]|uniref:hypothetical protein n=1 Tax=Geomonas ferrireducens TaxID=2570227 RepID=UPI0010A90FA8|nr:hypothetical protein [Geomonas ferrireducens]